MELNYTKIQASHVKTPLKVMKGHFATNHAHTNCYLDMTTIKSRISEAQEIAEALCQSFLYSMVIDTIVCTEGTEVIGAFLANELKNGGYLSQNAHKTIYVIKPEYISNGQMIFKENYRPMVEGKNIVILTTTVRTGLTINTAMEGVKYYGGKIQAVASIFSGTDNVNGIPIVSVFNKSHLPDYEYNDSSSCPMCKAGKKLDAILNQYGMQKL